jgi:two-component system, OmpR family, phosphate regulon sensor histidine kinase PhoR
LRIVFHSPDQTNILCTFGFDFMRPLVVFYILVIYIFIQLCWWAWLLFDLNNEVYAQRIDIIRIENLQQEFPPDEEPELLKKLHKRWGMIIGEGTVFLLLLVLGVVQTRKSFLKSEALNRQQRNFLLSVTHEFKSPLSSMKLYLQTLQKRDLPKEKEVRIITHAIEDADRLNALVENALLASQLESRNYAWRNEMVNFSSLLEGMLEKQKLQTQKQVNFLSEIEKDIHLETDRLALSSVVGNLMSNAVKYAPEGSSVRIFLRKQKAIMFSISNEGNSISDADKKKIFDKFYRIGNEETRSTKGTGLGLYIVKNLLRRMKASISVKDNKPNGTIFEIQF